MLFRSCDLSPDGEHFLYFALDGRWGSQGKGSFTAISKPPYWTALALFPVGHTWSGGGVFLDAGHFYADGEADVIGRAEDLRRVRHGQPEKGCTTGLRLETGGRAPLDRVATKRLLVEPVPSDGWELLQRMRIPTGNALDHYDTKGGKLYRRSGMDLELIRDFTDMSFEPIRAPYDWREAQAEDDAPPWHPLDGDGA